MATNYDEMAKDYPHDLLYMEYADDYTLFQLLGCVEGLSILDIGCGRGEHARRYKQMGARFVMGVDYSAEMIRLAQAERSRSPLGVVYGQMDMFKPRKLGKFDLVTAFSVISLAPTREKLLDACRTIALNVKPLGRFVTVGLNPEQAPATYALTEKYGCKILNAAPTKEGDPLRASARINGKDLFFEDYYFALATYEWALREAGFRDVRWHQPMISPEGIARFGEPFWKDFIDSQMSIYLECVK